MTPLSVRMREAADVLEQASKRYGYSYPNAAGWSADRLRKEADHVEAEENE